MTGRQRHYASNTGHHPPVWSPSSSLWPWHDSMSEPWVDSSALAHPDLPTVHILILSSLQAVSPFYSAFISLQGLFLRQETSGVYRELHPSCVAGGCERRSQVGTRYICTWKGRNKRVSKLSRLIQYILKILCF